MTRPNRTRDDGDDGTEALHEQRRPPGSRNGWSRCGRAIRAGRASPMAGSVPRCGCLRRRRLARVRWAAALAPAGLASCGDGAAEPDPPRAESLAVEPATASLSSIGDTAVFRATIVDQYGAAFAGSAAWASGDPSVFAVSAGGVVTAVGNGSAVLTASFQGLAATAAVAVVQVAASLDVASGDGQSARQGTTLPDSVAVRVADARGSPVEGVRVAFATADGHGSADPDSAATGADGIARTAWTLGDQPGPQSLAAAVARADGPSALAAATALTPEQTADSVEVASGNQQRARQGTALPLPVAFRVLDDAGLPVPGARVAFATADGHGSADPDSAATGADGIARTAWTLGDQPGPQSLAAAVARADGPSALAAATALTPEQTADSVEVASGNQQRARQGTALPLPVAFRVLDDAGLPVPGARVAFATADGHGSADPDSAATGADGIARTAWTLGDQPGPQSLAAAVARADGPSALAAATALTPEQTADSVEVASGNQQRARQGTALPLSVAFRVLDDAGLPVPGVRVAFATADGHGSADPDSAATGADGIARTAWTLGDQPGPQSLAAAVARADGPSALAAATALTPEQAVAAVEVVSGDRQGGPRGGSLPAPVVVVVLDAARRPVPGIRVSFAAAPGHGQAFPGSDRTRAEGRAQTRWILGEPLGQQRLVATAADGPSVQVTATAFERPVVNQPPSVDAAVPTLLLQVGGTSVALAGDSLFSDPEGDALDFSGATSDQTVARVSVRRDTIVVDPAATGSARIRISASDADGATASQTFWATVLAVPDDSGYDIDIADFTGMGISANPSFGQAVARWEQAIASDLPNQLVRSDFVFDACLQRFRVFADLDDLVAFVTVRDIDGPGGTLAQANLCAVRRPEDTGLPLFGYFYYDSADLDRVQADVLHDVTLHEIGHVLGIGSHMWHGLIANPSLSAGAHADTHFTGARARAAFDSAGGTAYTAGAKVPVDNRAIPGSSDVHWRQGVFGNELMNAFIYYNAANPLSAVTLESLADLGYTVNAAAADAWTFTAGAVPDAMAAVRRGQAVHMKNDIARSPVLVLDETGRVVRTSRR